MSEESDADRSINFLVVRSTDPFLNDSERTRHTRDLVSAVEAQLETPEFAFRLLAHKLLSPEHREAMNTLEVLDALVQGGGLKVEREIGKFKFLNSFIRLLSPKYQGAQTSASVRSRAIDLLFGWRESLRAQTKIRDVYDMLRKQNVIAADPTPRRTIAKQRESRSTSATRIASFEDGEKARILAELLRSKRADDLRAANRMIKGMVRAEDKRAAQFHKRQEVLNAASSRAELLWSMLENTSHQRSLLGDSANDADGAEYGDSDVATMKELQAALLAFRPMLFRYASEAAASSGPGNNSCSDGENGDDILAQMLALNDRVNATIRLFQERFQIQPDETTSHATGDVSNQLSILDSPNTVDSLIYRGRSISSERSKDVEVLCSPSDICKNCLAQAVDGKSTIDALKSNVDTLFEIDLRPSEPSSLLANKGDRKFDEFLLRDVKISLEELEICANTRPVVFLQESQLQGVLYPAKRKASELDGLRALRGLHDLRYALIVLSSTNISPVDDIDLRMIAANTLVSSRLLPIVVDRPTKRLAGFQLGQPVDALNYVFLLLPLVPDCTQTTVDYSLRCRVDDIPPESICTSGSFMFSLALR